MYLIYMEPTISSISKNGVQIIITGTNFIAGTIVMINEVIQENINISSSEVITIPFPNDTVQIKVLNTLGSSEPFLFTPPPTPTIYSINKDGDQLIIKGINFIEGIVKFNGIIQENPNISNTEISVPFNMTGYFSVIVTNPFGPSDPFTFIYSPPIIYRINKDGDQLIIRGTNFIEVTTVKFNEIIQEKHNVISNTEISVPVPNIDYFSVIVTNSLGDSNAYPYNHAIYQ